MTATSTSVIKKLLLLFLVFAGLYFAKEFLMPIAIGGIVATLFLPFCKWMEKKNLPRFLAVFICLLVILLAISGVGALLGWQISELSNDAAKIKQKALETGAQIQQYIFTHVGISSKQQTEILKDQQSSMSGTISTIAGSLTYILSSFLLMLVYVFLLLYYRLHIKQFILKLSSPAQRAEMEQVIYSATNVSQQYLVGLTKMIVCLWIMYGIGFSIAGVKSALFFAVLCGLLEIVPFIGNITGTTITVLVAAVNGGDTGMLIGIVITYGVVQFIQGWVLEPIIVGPQVKINPLATIVALILGELVWGIPGIILAIPVTAMLKIVCDHIDSLRPYGFLIGEIESEKKKPLFVTKLKTWFHKLRKKYAQ